MKAGTNLTLYLIGALILVILLLNLPQYAAFTGEIFIGIFILGLFLAFGNTVRQTQKIAQQKSSETVPNTNRAN